MRDGLGDERADIGHGVTAQNHGGQLVLGTQCGIQSGNDRVGLGICAAESQSAQLDSSAAGPPGHGGEVLSASGHGHGCRQDTSLVVRVAYEELNALARYRSRLDGTAHAGDG